MDDEAAVTDPAVRPVPPPPGLTKAQVKLWEQQEALRVARATGDLHLLTRRGRRALRAEAQVEAREQFRRDRAAAGDQRAKGLLVILTAAAVALLTLRLWPTSDEPTPAAPPVRAAATQPTAPAGTGSPSRDPYTQVMLAWWTLTCPRTPDQWAPAQPLMTGEAWEEAARTPIPVVQATWTCTNLHVEADSGVRADGTVIVRATADRTISTPTTAPVTEHATDLRVIETVDGQLLVGVTPRE